jgi:hypothetical protein
MSVRNLKLLISMEARLGVGQKIEQLVMRMSMSLGRKPVVVAAEVALVMVAALLDVACMLCEMHAASYCCHTCLGQELLNRPAHDITRLFERGCHVVHRLRGEHRVDRLGQLCGGGWSHRC